MYLHQHPLHQQQKPQPRQAQNTHRQCVEPVDAQRQPGDGGGAVQQPQDTQAQGTVQHHPQRQLQRLAEQPHHRHQQEQAHQGQGYDLYDGHTSPPFIAPAATQGGADGSVFSTGTACGMPEGTLWPFCSLIRRSR